MTDFDTTPAPDAAATTPTAPLPPIAETPVPAAGPVTSPPKHHASEGAIAVMVIGTLLFALLAFGAGWLARGAVTRLQVQRAGIMMRGGYGSFGYGAPGSGAPGAGAPGSGYGYGRSFPGGPRGRMRTWTPNGSSTTTLPTQ